MELKEALESDEKFLDYMMEGVKLFDAMDTAILNRVLCQRQIQNVCCTCGAQQSQENVKN